MTRKFVGIYDIGYERVRVYLRDGSGASLSFLPEDKGITVMEIGADQKMYRRVVSSIIHEAQEMSMCRLGLSFYPYGSVNNSTANCKFILDHEQFDECCGRTGELIAAIGADLYHAWKAWQLPRAKKPITGLKHPSPNDYPNDKDFKKAIREFHKKASEIARKKKG